MVTSNYAAVSSGTCQPVLQESALGYGIAQYTAGGVRRYVGGGLWSSPYNFWIEHPIFMVKVNPYFLPKGVKWTCLSDFGGEAFDNPSEREGWCSGCTRGAGPCGKSNTYTDYLYTYAYHDDYEGEAACQKWQDGRVWAGKPWACSQVASSFN